jgi:hypothetical protein
MKGEGYMNETLKNKLDLFAENKAIIAKSFKWDNSYLYPACSLIYTSKGLQADVESLKYCCDIIKSNTGVFSSFRGIAKLALAANLSIEENPEEMFERYLKAHDCLQGLFGLGSSTYIPFAASVMAKLAQPEEYERISEKAGHIFKLIKKDHPILTSGEDAAYAVLFALSDVWGSASDAAAEVERCYQKTKTLCFSSNSIQSLAFVLALSPENADIKCSRTIELFNAFKEIGHKYGTSYELSSLGILATSVHESQPIVHEICQADNYLKELKGFGNFRFGAKMRLMYASVLTSSEYSMNTDACLTSAVNSVTSMVIAQQVAIMCAVAAASAAASASSSSS